LEARRGTDGRTSYRAKVRLKGHPAETATFERKTNAKRWAQQAEAAIREGRHFHLPQLANDLLRRVPLPPHAHLLC